jgi:hypothetical protein
MTIDRITGIMPVLGRVNSAILASGDARYAL